MLFNSIDFAIFFPLVFLIYWGLLKGKTHAQNLLLLVASYVFYGWWDIRFVSLILLSTLVDYYVSSAIYSTQQSSKKKRLLAISLFLNLGLLGYFKYSNFFIDNFNEAFSFFGTNISIQSLQIILPVGISFYTFQTLSYTIDVYRGRITPAHNLVTFATYVGYFPQLVAGPIERAHNLLPQFQKERSFNKSEAINGLGQIIWGLFKKVVIADNCAKYADLIFNNYSDHSGSTLFLGTFFFAFQIYGDFSGYSDMAIGLSKLLGIQLSQNFNYPYFSRDIAEFWRRWHISLSTWFRDYLYIPLGGSKGGKLITVRNVFAIFLVSGFWHGANWTFIVWGGLNALLFLPILLLNKNRANMQIVAHNSWFPSLKEIVQMVFTFILVLIAWVYFRSENLHQANYIVSEIFSSSFLSIPKMLSRVLLLLIVFFTLVEWFGRKESYAIEIFLTKYSVKLVWGVYLLVSMMIFLFAGQQQEFVYFQF